MDAEGHRYSIIGYGRESFAQADRCRILTTTPELFRLRD
jgi:hypothetical protein